MSDPIRPQVRVVRVFGKPLSFAAYRIDNNALLGYCGRDGVIIRPEPDVPRGLETDVVAFEEVRMPRQGTKGIRKSLATIQGLFPQSPLDQEKQLKPPSNEWKLLERKEIGLYVSGIGPDTPGGARGFFQAVYEVHEHPVNRVREVRMRTELGPPCRLYGEGYEAFVSLFKKYAAHAREHLNGKHVVSPGECRQATEGKAPPRPTRPTASPWAKKLKKGLSKKAKKSS